METNELNQIVLKYHFNKTEKTINDSFLHGCLIWENKERNLYITDYNIGLTPQRGLDTKKYDAIILFRPGKQMILVSLKALIDKKDFEDIMNKFN